MSRLMTSLLVLLLLFVLPIGFGTIADTGSSPDGAQVTQETSSEASPQIYMDDNKLVIEGLRDRSISIPEILNSGIVLDAPVVYNDLDDDEVFSGQNYNFPVVISGANNVTIQDSTFSNINENYALNILNSINIKIVNNYFVNITSDENNLDTAPSTDLNVVKVSNSPGLEFISNTFEDIDANGSLGITILSMTGSHDARIHGNLINNYQVTETAFDFTGFDISSSNNLTIFSNYMYNVEAVDTQFISVRNGHTLNYYNNEAGYLNVDTGIGYQFQNFDNISSTYYNWLYYWTVGSGDGFTAFQYDTVSNVIDNYTSVNYITIEAGDFRAVQISGSTNITLAYMVGFQITAQSDRIVAFDVLSSTDVSIENADVDFLVSTATGIDLDNSQSIYGAYINDSSSISLNASSFNNFESNSQIFGVFMLDSQVFSEQNTFNNYLGSVIHGLVLERGLAGSQFNDSEYASWQAPQIYGLVIRDTVQPTLFFGEYFASMSYTTYGNGIDLSNSANITFLQNLFVTIYSYAPFFETALVSLVDSYDLVLESNVFFNIVSFYTQMSTINSYNVTDSLFLSNVLYINGAYNAPYVGMYMRQSASLNLTLNVMISIVSIITTLQLDVVDDNIGYGIVFEGTNSSIIANTTAQEITEWYTSDDASTGVTLVGNTVGGVEDTLASFEKPSDLVYDADVDAGATLTWTAATELPEQASNYTITMNGDLVQSGNWTSGQPISYDISGLEFGTYTVIIQLVQSNGFVSTDIVTITATELTAPEIISGPEDFTTVEDGTAELVWEVYEINPTSYSIYRGDIEIDYGFYEQNDTISYSLSDTPLGTHEFSIILRDEAGNEIEEFVVVTVVPASPIRVFISVDELTFEKGSDASIDFTINGTIEGDIVINVNDQPVQSIPWTSGIEIRYNLSSLEVGQYAFSFFVIDVVGNTESFDVLVNIIPEQDLDSSDDDEDSGFNPLDRARDLVEGVQDVELTQENLIPLAAAAFGGGAIFFPGMKFIRGRSANLAKQATSATNKATKK